ncbi:hypothetical protein M0R19_05045 [Candidatus Pacearchaeota archaeon]|nr:hypothetical protein [Candidatus Pacearchaeota archaeon]
MLNIPANKIGDWSVDHYEVTKEEASFYNMRAAMNRDMWGRIKPGTYTRLIRKNTVVMSDTPSELYALNRLNHCPRKKLLITGLGLGCAVRNAFAESCNTKPSEKVVVIEKSLEVIELVGKQLLEEYKDRLFIINGDAFEIRFKKDIIFDFGWHDIWDTICADHWPEIKKLKARFRINCKAQAAWMDWKMKMEYIK